MKNSGKNKPKHKWSVKERRALCLLKKLYSNGVEDVTKILNAIYKTTFTGEERCGLPVTTVKAQCVHLRHGSSGSTIWKQIGKAVTISEAKIKYPLLRQKIEDAALALQISLRLRSHEFGGCIAPASPPKKRLNCLTPKRRNRLPDKIQKRPQWKASKHLTTKDTDQGDTEEEVLDMEDSDGPVGDVVSLSDDTDFGQRSPRKKRCVVPEKDISPRSALASISKRAAPIKPKRPMPRLLYRFYSDKSQGLNTPLQLRAGKFCNPDQNITPPFWDMKSVSDHLTPKKSLTPYISFRDNILASVHFAFHADPHVNPCLVIVDAAKVRARSIVQWKSEEGVRSASEIVTRYSLKVGHHSRRYTGAGEWLVYGTIDREAIISTLTTSEVLQHINRIPAMNEILQSDIIKSTRLCQYLRIRLSRTHAKLTRKSGTAVGSLTRALGIPGDFMEDFALSLAANWSLAPNTFKTRGLYISAVLSRGDAIGGGNSDNLCTDIENEVADESDMTTMLSTLEDDSDCSEWSRTSSVLIERDFSEGTRELMECASQSEASQSDRDDNRALLTTELAFDDREDTIMNSSESESLVQTSPQPSTTSSKLKRPRSSTLFTFNRQTAVPNGHGSTKTKTTTTKSTRNSRRCRVITIDLCADEDERQDRGSHVIGPAPVPEPEPETGTTSVIVPAAAAQLEPEQEVEAAAAAPPPPPPLPYSLSQCAGQSMIDTQKSGKDQKAGSHEAGAEEEDTTKDLVLLCSRKLNVRGPGLPGRVPQR